MTLLRPFLLTTLCLTLTTPTRAADPAPLVDVFERSTTRPYSTEPAARAQDNQDEQRLINAARANDPALIQHFVSILSDPARDHAAFVAPHTTPPGLHDRRTIAALRFFAHAPQFGDFVVPRLRAGGEPAAMRRFFEALVNHWLSTGHGLDLPTLLDDVIRDGRYPMSVRVEAALTLGFGGQTIHADSPDSRAHFVEMSMVAESISPESAALALDRLLSGAEDRDDWISAMAGTPQLAETELLAVLHLLAISTVTVPVEAVLQKEGPERLESIGGNTDRIEAFIAARYRSIALPVDHNQLYQQSREALRRTLLRRWHPKLEDISLLRSTYAALSADNALRLAFIDRWLNERRRQTYEHSAHPGIAFQIGAVALRLTPTNGPWPDDLDTALREPLDSAVLRHLANASFIRAVEKHRRDSDHHALSVWGNLAPVTEDIRAPIATRLRLHALLANVFEAESTLRLWGRPPDLRGWNLAIGDFSLYEDVTLGIESAPGTSPGIGLMQDYRILHRQVLEADAGLSKHPLSLRRHHHHVQNARRAYLNHLYEE